MQYLRLSLATVAFATMATAQIPACATGCIADAVKSSTSCASNDLACQCTQENASKIQGAATACVIGMCGPQAINVLTAAQAACESVKAASSAPSNTVATSLAASSSVASSASAQSSSSIIDSSATTIVDSISSEAGPVTTSITASSYLKPSIGTGLPYPGANGTAVSTGLPQATSAAGKLIVGLGNLCVAALAALIVL